MTTVNTDPYADLGATTDGDTVSSGASDTQPWIDVEALIEQQKLASVDFFNDFILQTEALAPSGGETSDSLVWNGNRGDYVSPPGNVGPSDSPAVHIEFGPDTIIWNGDFGDYLGSSGNNDFGGPGADPDLGDGDYIIWDGNFGDYAAPDNGPGPDEGGYSAAQALFAWTDFIL